MSDASGKRVVAWRAPKKMYTSAEADVSPGYTLLPHVLASPLDDARLSAECGLVFFKSPYPTVLNLTFRLCVMPRRLLGIAYPHGAPRANPQIITFSLPGTLL